jgi:hypothetical protein
MTKCTNFHHLLQTFVNKRIEVEFLNSLNGRFYQIIFDIISFFLYPIIFSTIIFTVFHVIILRLLPYCIQLFYVLYTKVQ